VSKVVDGSKISVGSGAEWSPVQIGSAVVIGDRSRNDGLLAGLNPQQSQAVSSKSRRLFVVAGAGVGKTEVMARRIAWLIADQGVPKDEIVAFTFTERAAEEMKFRIRSQVAGQAAPGEEPTLGDMYVGTIHAFCLNKLRELAPDEYHNYDVIDDVGRLALVQRTYGTHLGLAAFCSELNATANYKVGQFLTIEKFLRGYDILNEYGELHVNLPKRPIPADVTTDREWCKEAELLTKVGTSDTALVFATSAARYYALLRSRRFLDFSTAQNELLRLLESRPDALAMLRSTSRVVVVDEVQDLNPVQRRIVDLIVGPEGGLVAVGDHRQAIFGFRGGNVHIMGEMYDEVAAAPDSEVVDLTLNYRSTPRIIALANAWAASIPPPGGLPNIDMRHGKVQRTDYDASHVGITRFDTVEHEAEWVAVRGRYARVAVASAAFDRLGCRLDFGQKA
jgi:DNA helicase-2/ATP-dependent DNA helicase PcrA